MQILKIVFKKHFLFLMLVFAAFGSVNAQSAKNKVHSDKGWSLFGALTLNNQLVNDKGITAPINYLYIRNYEN